MIGTFRRLVNSQTPMIVLRSSGLSFENAGKYLCMYSNGYTRWEPKHRLARCRAPTAKELEKFRINLEERGLDYYELIKQGDSPATQKEEDEMETLYTWTDPETQTKAFGHKLAVDSNGKWVMEKRGGAGLDVVARDAVEKVMPYTVDVEYFGRNGGTYSFFAKAADELKEGDVLLLPDYTTGVVVRAVDTKSEKATTWLEGVKVVGTKITGE